MDRYQDPESILRGLTSLPGRQIPPSARLHLQTGGDGRSRLNITCENSLLNERFTDVVQAVAEVNKRLDTNISLSFNRTCFGVSEDAILKVLMQPAEQPTLPSSPSYTFPLPPPPSLPVIDTEWTSTQSYTPPPSHPSYYAESRGFDWGRVKAFCDCLLTLIGAFLFICALHVIVNGWPF